MTLPIKTQGAPLAFGAAARSARALVLSPSLLLLPLAVMGGLAGCSKPGDTVAITSTRLATRPSHTPREGLTLMERAYGKEAVARERMRSGGNRPGLPPSAAGQNPLLYDVPEGWEELPRAQFRDINLRLVRDPSAEMVLTFLANDGGGLVPNIDRWRGQVGLGPMTDADIAALTTRTVFGREATYVELLGSYQGMSGPRIDDGGLFGAIFSQGGGTLFVKMTGSREVLEAERESFHSFLDSLAVNMNMGAPAAQPAQGGAGARTSPLEWGAIAGWTEEASTSQFREVTFRRPTAEGGSIEMYVSTAMGNALDNITRWAGQIGQPPLDEAALAKLERVDMLGRSGYVYEATGALSGMGGGPGKPGQAILAALVESGGQIVTVKMTGPAAEVEAARSDFMTLVGSLRARQSPR
ncbi:hypothetical protein [Planctomycetes bacterium Poly30]|uniref:hypothetical protein n=1 Tax=Saltatorellus ferox TaxID=2528018 RepID=UPI0011A17E39